MSRILTGIQSTETPHLGNLLGAILPAIELSKNSKNESFFFVADLHAHTQVKNSTILKDSILNTAITWLACGLDFEKNFFYRQSDISEVTQLMWILLCYFPYSRIKLAHSFKEKITHLKDINVGLLTYPILMAADILLYDANYVPVGKDQFQHLEFTRYIAQKFNHQHGKTFVIPKAFIKKEIQIIPGTDGKKMSKSRNNIINIFLPEKELLKQIYSIKTNSKLLEEPKNPSSDNIFQLFELLTQANQIQKFRTKYLEGNFGYKDAKQELFEVVLEKFKIERIQFNYYQNHPKLVEKILKLGAEKTRKIAQKKIKKIRSILGYK